MFIKFHSCIINTFWENVNFIKLFTQGADADTKSNPEADQIVTGIALSIFQLVKLKMDTIFYFLKRALIWKNLTSLICYFNTNECKKFTPGLREYIYSYFLYSKCMNKPQIASDEVFSYQFLLQNGEDLVNCLLVVYYVWNIISQINNQAIKCVFAIFCTHPTPTMICEKIHRIFKHLLKAQCMRWNEHLILRGA